MPDGFAIYDRLSDMADVALATPATGEALTYDATLRAWKNTPLATAPVISVAGRTGAITLTVTDISGLGTAATHAATDFDTAGAASTVNTALTSHTSNISNPHSVTKAQVGLANVSNAAQLVAANNLSDLANAGTARNNLGLGSIATHPTTDFVPITGANMTGQLEVTKTVTTINGTGTDAHILINNPSSIGQAHIDAVVNGGWRGCFRWDFGGSMAFECMDTYYFQNASGGAGTEYNVATIDPSGNAVFAGSLTSDGNSIASDGAGTLNLFGLNVGGSIGISGPLTANTVSITSSDGNGQTYIYTQGTILVIHLDDTHSSGNDYYNVLDMTTGTWTCQVNSAP